MDDGDAKALERLRREIIDLEAMDLLVSKRLSVARNERKAILARQRLATQHADPKFLEKKKAGLAALWQRPGYRDQYIEENRRRALARSPLKVLTAEQRKEYDRLIRKHMTAEQAAAIIFPKSGVLSPPLVRDATSPSPTAEALAGPSERAMPGREFA